MESALWRSGLVGALVAAARCGALAQSDLSVSCVPSASMVNVGELLTLQVSVTNLGPGAASGVISTNSLPTNATLFSISLAQGGLVATNPTIVWDVGSLAAGAGAVASIVLTPTAMGSLMSTSTVWTSQADPNLSNNAATAALWVAPVTFYPGPNLNVARAYHTATLLADGRVLIAGGTGASGPLFSAEIYDPVTKSFSLTGNMHFARDAHTATLLPDGTVLIAAGFSPGANYNPGFYSAEIYNPTNGAFTSVGSLSATHTEATSTLLPDGRVMIEGDSYSAYRFTGPEVYVPALGIFTNGSATYDSGFARHSFLLADGRVIIPGGLQPDGAGGAIPIYSSLYNPSSNSLSFLPGLNYARFYYGGECLLDGRIFLAGGGGSGQTAEFLYTNSLASNYITSVTATNSMRTPHFFATANRLLSGKVLVTGWGQQPDLFDPSNDSFSRTPDMLAARQYFTATALNDGTVLIVGGVASGTWGSYYSGFPANSFFASTEIYDPAHTKAPPAISASSAAVVNPGRGTTNMSFPVSLSAAMGLPVYVNYSTSSGSAIDGQDFIGTNGTAVFAPGVTNLLLPVVVQGNWNYQPDSSFTLKLSSATNAVVNAPGTATGTIVNLNPPPTVNVEPASVVQNPARPTNLVFNVLLAGSSWQSGLVAFATSDGTAVAGRDYLATNGVLVFEPGTTNLSVSVPISILPDVDPRPNRIFYLRLSAATNLVLGADGVGTIVDNEGLPGNLHHFDISLTDPAQYETFPMNAIISARDYFGQVATNFNGRAAVRGTSSVTPSYKFDFEEGNFSIWTPLNPGANSWFRWYDLNGDGVYTTAFGISPGSGAVYGITQGLPLQAGLLYYLSMDIAQSCELGGAFFNSPSIHLQVGGTQVATYKFGNIYAGQVYRTNLVATYLTPTNGTYALTVTVDYPYIATAYGWVWMDDLKVAYPRLQPDWTASFTNGTWSGVLTASGAATNYTVRAEDELGHAGDSTPFNILAYDDVALGASVAPNPARVGSNFTAVVLVTNLGPGTANGVVVTNPLPSNWSFVSATSSTAGLGFLSNNMIVCNLGRLTNGQVATATIVTRPMAAGTVSYALGASGPALDPNPSNNVVLASVTVNPPLLYVQGATVVERTGASTNTLVNVWVGTPFTQTIDVDYTTGNPAQGLAAATPGVDYLPASGHLTFAPGITNQTISVVVLDSGVPKPTEYFVITLTNVVNAQLAYGGTTNCAILDNFDPAPGLTFSDATVSIAGSGTSNATFTATLTKPTGYTVSIRYSTVDGTAFAGSDYVGVTNVLLSIPPGVTNQTFAVAVKSYNVIEPPRTFSLAFSSVANAVLLRATATATILDSATNTALLDHFDSSVVPNPQYASRAFSVSLTARDYLGNLYPSALTNAVNLAALAVGGNNSYAVSPSQVAASAFVGGSWTGAVSIASVHSNLVLRADDGQHHIGQSNPFDVLAANALLVTLPANATKGAGLLSGAGKVTLPGAAAGSVVVSLSSSDTSRVTVPASVTIASGQTNATFNLTVLDNGKLDGSHAVTITATASIYLSATTAITIFDNQTATLSVNAPATVSEGGSYSGTVSLSAAPGAACTVALSASDPRLLVPSSVSFFTGQTSAGFGFNVARDHALEGDVNATITAHVQNWSDGVAPVAILDSDANTLAFAFTGAGPSYPEGTLVVTNAFIRISSVPTNLTVSLVSDNTNAVVVPPSIFIPAGATSAAVSLTIVEDDSYNGTETANLYASAPGFFGASATVSVTENQLHHYAFAALPAQLQGSVPFAVSVSARDANDAALTAFNSYAAISAVDGADNPVAVQPGGIVIANGQWSGNVTVATWDLHNVRLVITDTDFRSAQSSPFDVLPPTAYVLNVAASDLAYSPTSHLLYASSATAGTLTPINPFNAAVGAPVAVPGLSGRLCAGDGGQYIFAALGTNSLNHVCQFDVSAQAVVNAWDLDGYYIDDMAPVIGSPGSVIVSRKVLGGSPHGRGVIVYDNGVPRSSGGGGNVIEASGTPTRIYGFDNEDSNFSFLLMNLGPSGLSVQRSYSLFSGFGADFTYANGLVFSTTGQIFDPERGLYRGAWNGSPNGGYVVGDAPSSRFYIEQFLNVNTYGVVAYDQNTLLPVGSTALAGIGSSTGSFVRFGTNGLAYRSASRIVLVRSSLIASGPPADLSLTCSNAAPAVLAGNTWSYTLTVSNAGPNPAQNVVLTHTFSTNCVFVSATASSGTATQATGGLVCPLLTLGSGASASVTITLQTLKPGLLASVASVTSDSPDPNPTNNSISVRVPVTYPSAPDTVVELALPTADLAYDRVSERIFASVPNADWLLGNNILALEPGAGLYDAPVPVAMDPAKLAVSDDGAYLYSGINSDASIQRVSLPRRLPDLHFPTGYSYPADIVVFPGNSNSIAVAASSTVVIYDKGVARPNTVANPVNYEHYLAFSHSNFLLYASYPNGYRRIAVDDSGATLLTDNYSMYANFNYRIKYDAGLIYSSAGTVYNPETGVVVTNLPYAGLVALDPFTARAFYLAQAGSTATLYSYDMNTFAELGSVTVPNVNGSLSSFIRWGADGFAFRTSANQLFLVRTSLLPAQAADSDGDGIPDWWVDQYFGHRTGLASDNSRAQDSAAGDGISNLRKYLSGKNPFIWDNLHFLAGRMNPDGRFKLTVFGQPAHNYTLQATTDFRSWTPLFVFGCPTSNVDVFDPDASRFPLRFYRLGPPSTVPGLKLAPGSASPFTTNGFDLVLSCAPGLQYRIDASTDLIHWTALTNFYTTNSTLHFLDPAALAFSQRFYRAAVP